jgi:DMSO/TMAO reductase YedYZ molybdopterin-dependent catalytic subunit
LFKLLETADNYVKYAKPGRRERAIERARKRYSKAAELAAGTGDTETLSQIELRLEDLERLEAAPDDDPAGGDASGPDYRGIVSSPLPEHAPDRVPPGQRLTRGWPVLHVGPIPRPDLATWNLRVTGEVARTVDLSYDELKGLGAVELRADMHCVTGWSKLDNVWEGVPIKTLLDLAEPTERAAFASVEADHGYTANVPLQMLVDDDALVAWGHNGADLQPKHGFPLRLVIPRLYAWKSVKWVRGFELLPRDRRGFWELRGYHNTADPWLEQRYSYQE